MKYRCFYETSLGMIGLEEEFHTIQALYLPGIFPAADAVEKETALLKKAFRQLQEYLVGKRKIFDLPLAPQGTEFQKKVWRELLKIPYGQTVSYKYIAEKIGNSRAARAVGMANHRNPIPIFIPCHRVVGASGNLTGFRGGLEIKQKLLKIEGG
ncbi:MAG: methylated-DNA--[protein]-cysteine S-methyltransferase [Planctomycetia bacterium]|nr:methylated-DNA--[protein]-cysteine S-methyltransferase [Planctomycetia bacterium]